MTRAPEYQNMSVPPFSGLTVGRATLAGPRFAIDIGAALQKGGRPAPTLPAVLGRLRRCGWRAAAQLLGLGPGGRGREARRAQRAAVAEILGTALSSAGVPDRIGLFCPDADPSANRLEPAACLAVLARRSGPLYLPARSLEPSLVQVTPLTLVFPEEVECAALD